MCLGLRRWFNSLTDDSNYDGTLTSLAFKGCNLFGIPIYVHYLLPLYFVFTFVFWLGIMTKDTAHFGYYVALLVLTNLVLWWTVLIHELCHALAGYLIGGHTDKILLWPLGGLAFTQPPVAYNDINDQNQRNQQRQRERLQKNVNIRLNEDDSDDGIDDNINEGGGICRCKCNVSTRMAQIIIAFGGPLSHLPHMVFWGLLFYNEAQSAHAGVVVGNPFLRGATWTQTMYTPIVDWFWYDFFMLSFALNFWLFLVNMCCAYPLDGSRIFVNALFYCCSVKKTAQIYCVVNGIIGLFLVVVSVLLLKYAALPFFAGIWSCIEVYNMVQALSFDREMHHPLIASTQ